MGVQLDTSGPVVHHLLFPNDSLLLCKAGLLENTEIMQCLKLYGEALGQMINTMK